MIRALAMHVESFIARWLPYKPERPTRHPAAHYRRLRRESARYERVAAMCEKYRAGGAVLDVGCGEGLVGVPRYVGIDRINGIDADTYEPDGRFAVIVFNESLYYFADPLACLRRYEQWLDGVFVISMYGVSKNRRVWRHIESVYRVVDGARVRGFGRSWDVKVLRPIFTTPAR